MDALKLCSVDSILDLRKGQVNWLKGDGRMCTLFEEIARENETKGIEKGKTEGRAEEIIESGFEFGLSENDILGRLQSKLDISLQMAQEYLLRFGKRTM